MKVTYYGHSCFSLETEGKVLLFDPFISGNPLAKNINIENISADYICVSHGHEDHTADLVKIAKHTNATVVCAFEIMLWLNKQGITNVHPMNIGGCKAFEFGSIKMTSALHSSSMADGTFAGPAAGFIINSGNKTAYYSGDTGLSMEMKLIGQFSKPDFALLPIGDNFTMGYEDAFLASELIDCNNIVALHYDTFGYIVVDREKAIKHFEAKGKKLHFISIGETLDI